MRKVKKNEAALMTKPKSDLAALDALRDEELQPDNENPTITAQDLTTDEWFRSADDQALRANLAERVVQTKP
jgi:hypothetical protein